MVDLLDEGLCETSEGIAKLVFTNKKKLRELEPVFTGPLEIKNDIDTDSKFQDVRLINSLPYSLLRVRDDGLDLLISFFQPKLSTKNSYDTGLFLTKLSTIELQIRDETLRLSESNDDPLMFYLQCGDSLHKLDMVL
jgi:hypothetical protein